MSVTASRPVCSGLRLLDIDAVSALLHCHPNTTRALVKTGDLQAVRIGRHMRVPVASVESFIAKGGSKGASE